MFLVPPELPSHGDKVPVGKDIKQNGFEAIPHVPFKFHYFCRKTKTLYFTVYGRGGIGDISFSKVNDGITTTTFFLYFLIRRHIETRIYSNMAMG